MALTLLRQGEYGQAMKYLTTARENVGYIKDPNDLGVVFFAEAVFRQRCDLDPEVKTAVGDRLPDSVETYSRQALEQLNIYCNPVRGQAPHPLPADQISRQQIRKRPHLTGDAASFCSIFDSILFYFMAVIRFVVARAHQSSKIAPRSAEVASLA